MGNFVLHHIADMPKALANIPRSNQMRDYAEALVAAIMVAAIVIWSAKILVEVFR